MRNFKLNRRDMLRGLGGVALALPTLEVMLESPAAAQTVGSAPKRYVVMFCGQSMGGDGDKLIDDYVPNTVGANYDLKSALAPLAAVKNEVSVVSGLRIPTPVNGAIPAGGRRADFHVSSLSPLLSGVRSISGSDASQGPTSDQLVANVIAGSTPFKSLAFRAQAAWYLSQGAPYGRDVMSYKKDSTGKVVPIPPTVSPHDAYTALFSNFTGTDTSAQAALAAAAKKRQSILDLVRSHSQKLMGNLGKADQDRLQRHMDEVRDLETRIAAIPPPQTATCTKPADPGADPGVGGTQNANAGAGYSISNGYSNEDLRARVFCDLITMAFACDLTRVASMMITMFQSHMNLYPITGQQCDVHELGHNGDPANHGTLAVSKAIAWHVKHYAYLVQKLVSTPDGAGHLIDSTAAVFVQEGGHGLDPSSGEQFSTHSTENMACLIAGRVGGLKPGQHVKATGMHPGNVLISAMNAVGVSGGLGEVSGIVPGLFA